MKIISLTILAGCFVAQTIGQSNGPTRPSRTLTSIGTHSRLSVEGKFFT